MMRASNFLRLRESVQNKYNVTHSTPYYLCVWKMKLQLVTVQVPPSLITQHKKPLFSCYQVKKGTRMHAEGDADEKKTV